MCRRRITTEVFIVDAKKVHGDRYDYSEVVCPNNHTKVRIICKEHGGFEQSYQKHVGRNYNCPDCRDEVKDTDTFINKSKKLHGDKYDYSKVSYTKNTEEVIIICGIHGEFKQKASNHLSGHGCRTCSGKGRTTEDIISMFKEIHGDKYDYSNVVFEGNEKKVILVCPNHGKFEKEPQHILYQSAGCPKCVGKGLTNDERISEAKKVHGDKYEYDKFNYVIAIKKTVVTCKNHGDFKVSPNDHINNGTGCPKCRDSKGERLVTQILNDMGIKFIPQYKFNDCTVQGKVYNRKPPFDFYLPNHNTLIEYDGRHHFEPVKDHGGEDNFKRRQLVDGIKNNYAKRNGINMIRIPYTVKHSEVKDYILKFMNV